MDRRRDPLAREQRVVRERLGRAGVAALQRVLGKVAEARHEPVRRPGLEHVAHHGGERVALAVEIPGRRPEVRPGPARIGETRTVVRALRHADGFGHEPLGLGLVVQDTDRRTPDEQLHEEAGGHEAA